MQDQTEDAGHAGQYTRLAANVGACRPPAAPANTANPQTLRTTPADAASKAATPTPAAGFNNHALSLACLCVAIALLFSAEWSGKSYFQPAAENLAVLVSEAINVGAYIACAAGWRTFERVFLTAGRGRAGVLLLTGAAGTLGRVLLCLSNKGASIDALGAAGIALHSLCEPALLLTCLCLLCQDNPRKAATVLPSAFMLAGLAMTLQQLADLALGTALVIAGPLLAAALILLGTRRPSLPSAETHAVGSGPLSPGAPGQAHCTPPHGARPCHVGAAVQSKRPSRMPLWPFILMVAYDLVYHLVITIDTATSSYGMLGLVALSAAALVLALAKGSDYSPLPLNKAALPCVVAALMCLTMAWPGPELAALLSNTGSAAFYLFALITFVMMCQRHEYVAARSLGAFLAVEHVGHLLGDLAGQVFNQAFPQGGMPLQVFAVITATAMVLVATLFFNDLDVARVFGLVPQPALSRGDSGEKDAGGASSSVVSVMSARESVAWQCAGAARRHNLTMREEEVLELMMLGLDNAQIAEELTVAPGTVKTHVSHLCRKLGASSRADAVEKARQV